MPFLNCYYHADLNKVHIQMVLMLFYFCGKMHFQLELTQRFKSLCTHFNCFSMFSLPNTMFNKHCLANAKRTKCHSFICKSLSQSNDCIYYVLVLVLECYASYEMLYLFACISHIWYVKQKLSYIYI